MKVFGISISQKTFLLPVMMTFAILLVVQGMRPPQLQKITKPKVHNRAVVQTQDKAFQTGIEKDVQAVVLSRCAELFESPSYHISVFPREKRNSSSITASFIPSRAPPASRI